jgi:hypothetical protein
LAASFIAEQIPDDRERHDQQHAHDHAAADMDLEAIPYISATVAVLCVLALDERRRDGGTSISNGRFYYGGYLGGGDP